MADVETKETVVVASPEKKVVVEEEKKEKKEEVEVDSKASEKNGDAKEAKENGSTEEKESEETEVVESTENGDSKDDVVEEVCCVKRKSTVGIEESLKESSDVKDGVVAEKKAKIEEKTASTEVEEAESNGATETAA